MDNLLTLKSDAKILDALKEAAKSKQSAHQINEQRISFIYGSIKEDSNITKAQIIGILSEKQGLSI